MYLYTLWTPWGYPPSCVAAPGRVLYQSSRSQLLVCYLHYSSSRISDVLLLLCERWQTLAQSRAVFTHWTHCSRSKAIAMSQPQPLASGARVWITSRCSSFACITFLSIPGAVSNSSCEQASTHYILTAGNVYRRLICLTGKLSILLQSTLESCWFTCMKWQLQQLQKHACDFSDLIRFVLEGYFECPCILAT